MRDDFDNPGLPRPNTLTFQEEEICRAEYARTPTAQTISDLAEYFRTTICAVRRAARLQEILDERTED